TAAVRQAQPPFWLPHSLWRDRRRGACYKNRLAAARERLHRSGSSNGLSHLSTAAKAPPTRLETQGLISIHHASGHFHPAHERANRGFWVVVPALRGPLRVEGHHDQIRLRPFPELASRILYSRKRRFSRAHSAGDSHSQSPKTRELPHLRQSPREARCE